MFCLERIDVKAVVSEATRDQQDLVLKVSQWLVARTAFLFKQGEAARLPRAKGRADGEGWINVKGGSGVTN